MPSGRGHRRANTRPATPALSCGLEGDDPSTKVLLLPLLIIVLFGPNANALMIKRSIRGAVSNRNSATLAPLWRLTGAHRQRHRRVMKTPEEDVDQAIQSGRTPGDRGPAPQRGTTA
jgi:hypothetical protein